MTDGVRCLTFHRGFRGTVEQALLTDEALGALRLLFLQAGVASLRCCRSPLSYHFLPAVVRSYPQWLKHHGSVRCLHFRLQSCFTRVLQRDDSEFGSC